MLEKTINSTERIYTIEKNELRPVLTLRHVNTETSHFTGKPFIVSVHWFSLFADDIALGEVACVSANPEKYEHKRFLMTFNQLTQNDFCHECYNEADLTRLLKADFRHFKRWDTNIRELNGEI